MYKFKELSSSAKKRAIKDNKEINVCRGWTDSLIDDAKDIGLHINSFNPHTSTIYGRLELGSLEVARLVRDNHGKGNATRKAVDIFLKDGRPLKETEKIFERRLLNAYRKLLIADYKFLTSKKMIIRTLKTHIFDEKGRIND